MTGIVKRGFSNTGDGLAVQCLPAPVRIDPKTGTLAGANNKNAIYESFREGQQPERQKTVQTPMHFDGRQEDV